MRPRIRAVSFDIGGTLIQPWPSVGQVYADAAAASGFSNLSSKTLDEGFKRAWKSRERFDYSVNEWRELVIVAFEGLCTREQVNRFFPDLYERFSSPEAWHLFQGVSSLLADLRARGFLLGVTSNWDERLRPLLKSLNLSSHFSVIMISAEAGYQKPDPRIFLKTCSALGVSPEETLHVGDSAREDRDGALAAGLSAALFDPRHGDLLCACVEQVLSGRDSGVE